MKYQQIYIVFGAQHANLSCGSDPHLGPSLIKGLVDSHDVVDLVSNGEEALTLELAVPYNLIILDIMLPLFR